MFQWSTVRLFFGRALVFSGFDGAIVDPAETHQSGNCIGPDWWYDRTMITGFSQVK